MSDPGAARLEERRKEALTRLTRLANRKPETSSFLDQAMECRSLEELAAVAFEVAAESGDPAGRALVQQLEGTRSVALIERVVQLCDATGVVIPVSLREAALIATRRLFEIRWQEAADGDEHMLESAAVLATNLANRLGDLGQWHEALAANQKSLDLYRRLAVEVGSWRHREGLGTCLNNHCNRLIRLNRWQQALHVIEEAVAVHRRLAHGEPSAKHFRGVASSLDNLSIVLSELNRTEEGLDASREAAELRRQYLGKEPDSWISLAGSLANLGGRLYQLGRPVEARPLLEESVEIRRQLAGNTDNLDSHNHLPDLARSLQNLGLIYDALELHDETLNAAEEAVDLRRKLARARPDAFDKDLALSLHSLGLYRRQRGDLDLAHGCLSEAILLRRRLLAAQPEAMASLLADSLQERADVCEALGDVARAIEDARKSVELRAPCLPNQPHLEIADFDITLRQLLRLLARSRRWDEMLAVIEPSLAALEACLEGHEHLVRGLLDWLRKSSEIAAERLHSSVSESR